MLSNRSTPSGRIPIEVHLNRIQPFFLDAVYPVDLLISNFPRKKNLLEVRECFKAAIALVNDQKWEFVTTHFELDLLQRWMGSKEVTNYSFNFQETDEELTGVISFSFMDLNVVWEIYFDFESVNPEHYLSVDDNGTKQYYKGNLWKILQNERRIFKGR